MEADAWLVQLREALDAAREGGLEPVTSEERQALLDLARIAAHGSERWTAPISTYLAGLALADLAPAERGRRLRELVAELE